MAPNVGQLLELASRMRLIDRVKKVPILMSLIVKGIENFKMAPNVGNKLGLQA